MRFILYLSWLAQLMVGGGLLSVSFFIQYAVLQSVFNGAFYALALALIMAMAKVSAIVSHRYLINQHNNAYPVSIRWTCAVFKAGLFALSMLCSTFYLVSQLSYSSPEIIAACRQLAQTAFNWQPPAMRLIFFLSSLISVLIELGLLLSFETITVSMQSLMQILQAYELDKQVLKAQISSQKQAANIKHDADIAVIRSTVDKTVDKAKAKMPAAF